MHSILAQDLLKDLKGHVGSIEMDEGIDALVFSIGERKYKIFPRENYPLQFSSVLNQQEQCDNLDISVSNFNMITEEDNFTIEVDQESQLLFAKVDPTQTTLIKVNYFKVQFIGTFYTLTVVF